MLSAVFKVLPPAPDFLGISSGLFLSLTVGNLSFDFPREDHWPLVEFCLLSSLESLQILHLLPSLPQCELSGVGIQAATSKVKMMLIL